MQLELNKVYLGDCLEILKEIPDESIDLIWFSPPYWNLHKYTDSSKEIGYNQSYKDYIDSLVKIGIEGKRILKNTGNFVVNVMDVVRNNIPVLISDDLIYKIPLIFIERIVWFIPNKCPVVSDRRFVNKFEWILHFAKTQDYYFNKDEVRLPSKYATIDKRQWKYNKKGKCPGNIWEIPARHIPNSEHPASFPVELCERVIKVWSKKNDIILDPFAGAGNSLISAKNLNRNFIGIELSEKYYKIILNKLKQLRFEF